MLDEMLGTFASNRKSMLDEMLGTFASNRKLMLDENNSCFNMFFKCGDMIVPQFQSYITV